LPADEDVVWLALEQLQKVHLLREPLPCTGEGMQASRREALRELGLVGSSALLLTGISSIVAPTPAIAQYGGFLGTCLEGCGQAEELCNRERPGQATECAAGRARCEARCRAAA
jgi:hypothetical protein